MTGVKSVNTTQNTNITNLTTDVTTLKNANLPTRMTAAETRLSGVESVNTTQSGQITTL